MSGFLDHEENRFRPQYGQRSRGDKSPSLSGLRSLRVKGVSGKYRSFRAVRTTANTARRVMVKSRFVKLSGFGKYAVAEHLKYIARDGVDKEGREGKMFGENDEYSPDILMETMPGEERQFRFIISPEDAENIDLEQYTKQLMRQMQQDLGRELYWGGVAHYNTDNPHVHIVVRGVDKRGADVMIHPDYISNGIRDRASEIATNMLGHRSEHEIITSKMKEISQLRVTGLDREIGYIKNGDTVDLNNNGIGKMQRNRLHERLKFLQKLGVAIPIDGYKWNMADDWKKRLIEHQQYNDKMQSIEKTGIKVEHKRIFGHGMIQGRVAQVGLSNELYDRYYMVIETTRGEGYYVELNKFERHEWRRHDIVSVQSGRESWGKPSDKNIQRLASENGGIYDTTTHRASIPEDTVYVGHIQVEADDFVEAHRKRIGSLVRYGLAEQVSDTSWLVAPDIVEQLKIKDKEGSKTFCRVTKESAMTIQEQVSYRGNTWLDKHLDSRDQKSFAGYGFGNETKDAIRRRVLFLQQDLGIGPADQWRTKKLTDIEKHDYAKGFEKHSGYSYKGEQSAIVKDGKLSDSGALSSGRRYAVIMNEKTREFSMLPWRKQYEQLQGKQVQIDGGDKGRWMVRQLNRSRGLGR